MQVNAYKPAFHMIKKIQFASLFGCMKAAHYYTAVNEGSSVGTHLFYKNYGQNTMTNNSDFSWRLSITKIIKCFYSSAKQNLKFIGSNFKATKKMQKQLLIDS
jgi:hypothetical protein